jgi:cyclase
MPGSTSSQHLIVEPLGRGVWAALHRPGGWAVGNAGIIDLGDATVVFDTTMTAGAGADLRQAAEELTGRPPDVVVLSHYHNDHVRGAEVFPNAALMSTHRTREAIDTLGRQELENNRQKAEANLRNAREKAAGTDQQAQICREFFVPYWEALAASAPTAELRLPTVTVEQDATLCGPERRAELSSYGNAHSVDDAVLHLPDDGITFCADLLFVDCHPVLPDGNPEVWLAALERLAQLDSATFVPGHGPVGDRASVHRLDAHLRNLLGTAERLRREGASAKALDACVPEGEAASWGMAIPFHRANLRFLVERG